LNKLISSVFFHELKNSLSSIKFSIQILDKYDMSVQEKKENIQNIVTTIDNTTTILEEYMEFIKFQFTKKLQYKEIHLDDLLNEIKKELSAIAYEKAVNIYIQKNNVSIVSNEFWLKRAIYNIIQNAIKYNKHGGSVNIKIEKDLFGIYLSISDTGVGINQKSLSSIFKMFHQIDDTKNGVGIGLALSKSIMNTFGGQINVKSNENIGTEFILYIPKKPKEVTIKKIALGLIPASITLFLAISYFPIYSQNYTKSLQGGYVIYTLEDGSVLKYTENSTYKLNAHKNLYNTKFTLSSVLNKGDMSLKAIKNKASIMVNDREFNNLGTDFEVIKDNYVKVAVFEGKIKSYNLMLNQGEGGIISDEVKVVGLLKPPRCEVKNSYLSIIKTSKIKKYKIVISKNKAFSNIEESFFTINNQIKLDLKSDTLYFIKVFAYDKYGLPSLPMIKEYVNLSHYKTAMKLLHSNLNEAILELESSISTIKNNSSLPYYQLSNILYKQKNYIKSLELIKKALKIKKDKKYYYLLLDNYLKLNKNEEIEKTLNKILSSYPNDIKLLFFKANILFYKSQYKEASKILFKILQQKPNLKEANILMSKVLNKLNKKDEAKYYERLVK